MNAFADCAMLDLAAMSVHDEPPQQNLKKIVLVMIVATFVVGYLIGSQATDSTLPHMRAVEGTFHGIVSVWLFVILCKFTGRWR